MTRKQIADELIATHSWVTYPVAIADALLEAERRGAEKALKEAQRQIGFAYQITCNGPEASGLQAAKDFVGGIDLDALLEEK